MYNVTVIVKYKLLYRNDAGITYGKTGFLAHLSYGGIGEKLPRST